MVVKKEMGDKIVKKIRQKKPSKKPEASDVDSESEQVMDRKCSCVTILLTFILRNRLRSVKNDRFVNPRTILKQRSKKKRKMKNVIHR